MFLGLVLPLLVDLASMGYLIQQPRISQSHARSLRSFLFLQRPVDEEFLGDVASVQCQHHERWQVCVEDVDVACRRVTEPEKVDFIILLIILHIYIY